MEKIPIKLYNTATRSKQAFKPLKAGRVGMYSCGPTVYDYPHIGNLLAYVFVDTLKRVLAANGLKVKAVMNITDVGHLTSDADTGEDKMEKAAAEKKMSAWELAVFYTKDFFDAMRKLNVQRPDIVCKATDHIPQMIKLIKKLEKKGYTYKTSAGTSNAAR
jgi:cysteinyl-tRNA synthetase